MTDDERDEYLQNEIYDLMTEGESCDPYGVTIHKNVPYVYYNLFEGLSEVPESEQKRISELWREAASKGGGYMNLKSNLFDHLDKIVKDYWLKCAKHQAEDEL